MNIYEFNADTVKGENKSLVEYRGKVVLVVNTASKCGFTPQYAGLEELYKKYEGKLEILAFPCNQFGKQEPGDDEEIASFCDLQFNITFPLFSKVDVNGKDTHPLFDYLKGECPGLLGSKGVKWNFTKFLIDKEGKPFKRFAPKDSPESLIKDIDDLVNS